MAATDDPAAVRQLEQRVAALELQLDLLTASIDQRLRTRRLAVVDDDGVERVVLEARHRTGSVLVRVASDAGRTTGIELFACDPDDEPPALGWCVLQAGDVAATWLAS